MPKFITHGQKLIGCSSLVEEFLAQASTLSEKLAVLLVQLPPKLDFNEAVATEFFRYLQGRTGAEIACEPRHSSWFTREAGTLLEHLAVARVGADPAICEPAAHPGKWGRLSYWRLHGSPVMYRSSYLDRVEDYATQLGNEISADRQVWCIFDNTASSAATGDALALTQLTSTQEE
jgi:uncharacterized protein YecE (DUF72 family)